MICCRTSSSGCLLSGTVLSPQPSWLLSSEDMICIETITNEHYSVNVSGVPIFFSAHHVMMLCICNGYQRFQFQIYGTVTICDGRTTVEGKEMYSNDRVSFSMEITFFGEQSFYFA